MHSVWRDSNPTGSSDQLGRATLVWQVGGTVSPWWDVDTLLAGDLLEVVPMAMGEVVALVSAVPADYTGIVFGDVGAATRSPDVRSTFGASGLSEIGWSRPSYSMCIPSFWGVVSGQIPWDCQNSRIRARLWRTVFRTVTWSASRPLSSQPSAVQNSPNCAPR